jgi:hypothetical protein
LGRPDKSWHCTLEEGYRLPPLEGLNLGDAVAAVNESVAKHIETSEEVRLHLTALAEEPDGGLPKSPLDEIIKYLARRRGDIDKSDPSVNLWFMENFVAEVANFQRRRIVAAQHRGLLDATRDEHHLICTAVNAAQMTDMFWGRWFERLAAPYQKMSAEERVAFQREAGNILPQFDYTGFDIMDGAVVGREPWAVAIGTHVDLVVKSLLAMADGLGDATARTYLTTLADAYACTDIDRLEERWAAVDRAWIRIPPTTRVFPVHGMESGYEHPFGVSPEFRLAVRVTNEDESRVIEGFRRATYDFALEQGEAVGLKALDSLEDKLSRLDIGVFVSAVEGGTCLNFRYAGQVVPNRQDILAEGGKIFVDRESNSHSVKMYREVLEKHCDRRAVEFLAPLITEDSMFRHTVGHECFHPVARLPESEVKLGKSADLMEEAKATVGGLLVDFRQKPALAAVSEMLAVTVARVLRFMNRSRLEDETIAPYVRENLVAAKTLLDSRLLRVGKAGVEFNFHTDAVLQWARFLRAFIVDEVIPAYRFGDAEEVALIREKYCGTDDRGDDRVARLIAWVNRDPG